ncbi:MAG: hypothetical protein HC860_11970 [Alkalinema sp. RU_4_3]|nr:hypothetical protein [Alkalinema sp. RU_4_3]
MEDHGDGAIALLTCPVDPLLGQQEQLGGFAGSWGTEDEEGATWSLLLEEFPEEGLQELGFGFGGDDAPGGGDRLGRGSQADLDGDGILGQVTVEYAVDPGLGDQV